MVGRCEHRPAVSSENLAGAGRGPAGRGGCDRMRDRRCGRQSGRGQCVLQPTVNRSTDDATLRLPFRGRKKWSYLVI